MDFGVLSGFLKRKKQNAVCWSRTPSPKDEPPKPKQKGVRGRNGQVETAPSSWGKSPFQRQIRGSVAVESRGAVGFVEGLELRGEELTRGLGPQSFRLRWAEWSVALKKMKKKKQEKKGGKKQRQQNGVELGLGG